MSTLPAPAPAGKAGSTDRPLSLLARHLGSEAAAEEARRQIDRRQREDALRYRRLAEGGGTSPDEAELLSLRAEVRSLRDQLAQPRRLRADLPEIVRRETRALLAAELPEAVAYLTGRARP